MSPLVLRVREAKFWLEPRAELARNYGLSEVRLAAAPRSSRSMSMKPARRGSGTSRLEVTNVSREGFSLLIGRTKRFVGFKDFPWFRDASIAQISNVTLPSPHHLRWPELDVDLAVKSLDHPEQYPLVSRVPAAAHAMPKRSLVKERRKAYKAKTRDRRPSR